MGPQASTLAFTSLTTGQLLHSLSCRSATHSVFDGPSLPANPYLTAALVGSLGLQALALVVPGLRSLLGVTPINLIDGLVIGAGAVLPFVVNEKLKTMTSPSRAPEEAESQPSAHASGFDPLPV
jgi:Ca2+-transporting ATPase